MPSRRTQGKLQITEEDGIIFVGPGPGENEGRIHGDGPPGPKPPRPRPLRPITCGNGNTPTPGKVKKESTVIVDEVDNSGGGVPGYRFVGSDEVDPGCVAAWQPIPTDAFPNGCVLLNQEHYILQNQIDYWREKFPHFRGEDVQKEVLCVYGEVAVAKVAQSEEYTSMVAIQTVEGEMRNGFSLTFALGGGLGEDCLMKIV